MSKIPVLPLVTEENYTNLLLFRGNDGKYIQQYTYGESEPQPWPEYTEICCRHDCHPIRGRPYPLISGYDNHKKCYIAYGYVCSGGCGLQFLIERNFPDGPYQKRLFLDCLRDTFGIHETIRAAKPQHLLSIFNGPYTIEQFRSFLKEDSRTFVREKPLILFQMSVEEHTSIPKRGTYNGGQQEDVLMQDVPSTASGDVPNGGLFTQLVQGKKNDAPEENTNPQTITSKTRKARKTQKQKAEANEGTLMSFMKS